MNNDKIQLSINLDKINIDDIKKHKSGRWLNIIAIPTPNNKFGKDYMLLPDLTKEQRENSDKRDVLGNAKFITYKPEDGEPVSSEPRQRSEKLPWE